VQLGVPASLIGIRRVLRACAVVRITNVPDVSDHPPSSVPMIPIEHPNHMGLEMT
jgi:hypothetical protein